MERAVQILTITLCIIAAEAHVHYGRPDYNTGLPVPLFKPMFGDWLQPREPYHPLPMMTNLPRSQFNPEPTPLDIDKGEPLSIPREQFDPDSSATAGLHTSENHKQDDKPKENFNSSEGKDPAGNKYSTPNAIQNEGKDALEKPKVNFDPKATDPKINERAPAVSDPDAIFFPQDKEEAEKPYDQKPTDNKPNLGKDTANDTVGSKNLHNTTDKVNKTNHTKGNDSLTATNDIVIIVPSTSTFGQDVGNILVPISNTDIHLNPVLPISGTTVDANGNILVPITNADSGRNPSVLPITGGAVDNVNVLVPISATDTNTNINTSPANVNVLIPVNTNTNAIPNPQPSNSVGPSTNIPITNTVVTPITNLNSGTTGQSATPITNIGPTTGTNVPTNGNVVYVSLPSPTYPNSPAITNSYPVNAVPITNNNQSPSLNNNIQVRPINNYPLNSVNAIPIPLSNIISQVTLLPVQNQNSNSPITTTNPSSYQPSPTSTTNGNAPPVTGHAEAVPISTNVIPITSNVPQLQPVNTVISNAPYSSTVQNPTPSVNPQVVYNQPSQPSYILLPQNVQTVPANGQNGIPSNTAQPNVVYTLVSPGNNANNVVLMNYPTNSVPVYTILNLSPSNGANNVLSCTNGNVLCNGNQPYYVSSSSPIIYYKLRK